MLEHLQEVLLSSPQGLTDMQRESEEEAAERHQRMLACCLAALTGLCGMLLPTQPQHSPVQVHSAGPAASTVSGCSLLRVLSYQSAGLYMYVPGCTDQAVRRAAAPAAAPLTRPAGTHILDMPQRAHSSLAGSSPESMPAHVPLLSSQVVLWSDCCPAQQVSACVLLAALTGLCGMLPGLLPGCPDWAVACCCQCSRNLHLPCTWSCNLRLSRP